MKFVQTAVLSTLVMFLSACASNNHDGDSRKISSEERKSDFLHQQGMLVEFEENFYSENPMDFYTNIISEIGKMFYHNQALVNEFDLVVGRGEDPLQNPVYEELWHARDKKDHIEEKMAFHFVKLDDLLHNGSVKESAIAKEIITHLSRSFAMLEDHQKVAYADIMAIYKDYTLEGGRIRKGGATKDKITESFDHFFEGDFSWQNYFEKNSSKIQKDLERNVNVKGLRDGLKRKKVQKLVYPSAGKEGNLFGYNIPRGVWALTYDDGPRAKTTREILRLLKAYDTKATFFWLAQNAESNREMISLARADGMGLANHSYTHANVLESNSSVREREIVSSTRVLEALYGQKVEFFRLPYGAGVSSDSVRRIIAEQGLIHVHWSVDSLDWQDKNPQSIFNRVSRQMEKDGRGIILFHDIHAQTIETTKLLLDYTNRANRNSKVIDFKTMAEIRDMINGGATYTGGVASNISIVKQDAVVRSGSSVFAKRCAELPQGTRVRVLAKNGNYSKISVESDSVALRSAVASCGRDAYILTKNLQ